MKVSIITSVYNSQDFLDDYINSLINQTYKNLEIICVDDGSSDHSLSLLLNYQHQYPHLIKVIPQQHLGVSQARNKALRLMSGECYTFIDSDDWISENAIEEAVKQIQEDNVDASLFTLKYVYPDYPQKNFTLKKRYEGIISSEEMFKNTLDWTISAFGLYKSIYKDISYINDKNSTHFDDEFHTRKLALRLNNVAINDGVYYYRQRENSVSTSLNLGSLGIFNLQYKTKELLKKKKIYHKLYLPFEIQSIKVFIGFLRKFTQEGEKLSLNERSFILKSLRSFRKFINLGKVFKSFYKLSIRELLMLLFFMMPIRIQLFVMKAVIKLSHL